MSVTKRRLPPEYEIGPMTRAEAGLLISWAAAEGWNPGTADLDVAWAYDPEAFIALRRHQQGGDPHGELVGGGAILSYGGQAGFMGLFIVRADQRGLGLGRVLWHERLRRLRARLHPDAWIGMDGVLDMSPFYAAGGFNYQYRDLRFEGRVPITRGVDRCPSGLALAALSDVPFEQLHYYDERIVGVARGNFLRHWVGVSGAMTCAVRRPTDHGAHDLLGYGVLRPCLVGYKLGPVFADDPAIARVIIGELIASCPGEQVQIDIPELNMAALQIVKELGWRHTFACARMIYGKAPPDTHAKVFGVTSFEFG